MGERRLIRRSLRWLAAPALWIGGVSVLAASMPSRGHLDEPPAGFSGGFGEQSCDACHFSFDLNDPAGGLLISGVPPQYLPGESYPITLTLTRPGMAIGGIQLAVRFTAGGEQAGTLAPAEGEEGRLTVSTSYGVAYAQHLREGTALVAPDTARWNVLWTAPTEGGRVRFNAAGNAADQNDSQFGDYIYTAAVEAEP